MQFNIRFLNWCYGSTSLLGTAESTVMMENKADVYGCAQGKFKLLTYKVLTDTQKINSLCYLLWCRHGLTPMICPLKNLSQLVCHVMAVKIVNDVCKATCRIPHRY